MLGPGGRDRRQRSAVADGQQAGDPHAARAAAAAREVERELVELRESCFRSEDFREGVRAFAREAQAARGKGASAARPALRPERAPTVADVEVPPLISQRRGARARRDRGPRRDRGAGRARLEARVERFGDSTDMCSLVNAKSGGCAEDCGFCAQSRFAEADTPMHAMMTPEQILEHAQAAEAAGAHRFCMVTQGQGLSKRDFQNILEGAKLVAEHTNLKRCASIGHMSVERAKAAQGGRASSASTTTSRPPRATTRRSRRRSATRAGCARSTRSREAGLETCVGGILNLGESREQRVEMAFQLAQDRPDQRADQPAQPAARARSSATATTWTRGRRSSGSRSSG